VEDIITELSRFQRLFVIARNTSFTYKGRNVDVKKVARELGVHFVLEGSVRKAGNRVRVTAQLIDGDSGRHVWAERYDEVLSDLFDLQERVTRQVVASMVPEIEAEESRQQDRGRRRFTEADDLSWRAQKSFVDSMFGGGPPLAAVAIEQAERAIEKDRQCALAWQILASTHVMQVFFGWTQDRKGSMVAARRAADTLMMIASNDSRSYSMRGFFHSLSGDFGAGAADLRKAYEMNPNDMAILRNLSWTEAAEGNVERAKDLAMQAMRLSPKDRFLGISHLALAMCAFIEDDLTQMRHWAELGLQSQASGAIRRVMMIAYATQVGDIELRRQHVEKIQEIAPDFIPSLFRGDYRPFHREEHMHKLLEVLRKAGLGN
jgi:Flp pilus assembly protein TadD